MISFRDFSLDPSIVAHVIYRDYPHQTTGRGVVLDSAVTSELQAFLAAFTASLGNDHKPYYRIDAYFDEESLWILEVNAAFVDGWGTALNLARASGIEVDLGALWFPENFTTLNPDYRPELALLVAELAVAGREHRIKKWPVGSKTLVYVYGRIDTNAWSCDGEWEPYDGLRLDNKLNLGLFRQQWDGEVVEIPRHYIGRCDQWEDIPNDVVLKFCDKGSEECQKARWSVSFGKPSGKAPFIKRCYRAETLLAQSFIRPTQEDGKNCQLVILAMGSELITGYVQYSQSRIVNDNSIHGPLMICR
jgi:hypothetical protein